MRFVDILAFHLSAFEAMHLWLLKKKGIRKYLCIRGIGPSYVLDVPGAPFFGYVHN